MARLTILTVTVSVLIHTKLTEQEGKLNKFSLLLHYSHALIYLCVIGSVNNLNPHKQIYILSLSLEDEENGIKHSFYKIKAMDNTDGRIVLHCHRKFKKSQKALLQLNFFFEYIIYKLVLCNLECP